MIQRRDTPTPVADRRAGPDVDMLALLRRYWGADSFRPGQEAVVSDVLDGASVLAIMPTGAGKSLCYQLPALVQPGITLVVSPLLALMEDQTAQLRSRGIPAEHLHSGMSFRRREDAWNAAEHGACKLVFVSPETLQGEVFRARGARLGVSRLVVDEAHCISEWGHDFRPAYRSITAIMEVLGKMPLTAVTATATPRVRKDIVNNLSMERVREHVLPIDRPNITWSVYRETNLARRVDLVLEQVEGQAILYGGTRANVEAWAFHLQDRGISSRPYHAGLPMSERTQAQQAWIDGACRVIAATSAFGMGVDKSDVRVVLHTMLPLSLEAYYQEAGRAGRDGAPSHAILIAPDADDERIRTWSRERYPGMRALRRVYDVVCDLSGVAIGGGADHNLLVDAERVGVVAKLPTRTVAAAVSLMDGVGVWRAQSPEGGKVRLRIGKSRKALERARDDLAEHLATRNLAEALLGADAIPATNGFVDVSLKSLSARSGLDLDRVQEGLRFFRQRALLEDALTGGKTMIQLSAPRSARPDLGGVRSDVLRRRAARRAEDVIAYASITDCRRRVLLTYFGERPAQRCGACDNCLSV